MDNKKNINGFTIVELLVVAIIIGILAVLGTVSYKLVMQSAVESGLKADINSAENIIANYLKEYGHYPYSFDANSCPLDSTSTVDTDFCLKPSTDNTYNSYTVDNISKPPSYDITVTNANGSTLSTSVGNTSRSGVLSLLTTINFDGGISGAVAVSEDNKTVYLLDKQDNLIYMYSRNVYSGTLNALSPATIATGLSPSDIKISKDGKNVYVSNGNAAANTISVYTRNTTTGVLTVFGAAVATMLVPSAIAVTDDGSSVYAVNYNSHTIVSFGRSLSDGSLTAIGTSLAAGTNPSDVCISPDGTYVYATSRGSAYITRYSRSTSTGILTRIDTIPTGTTPTSIAISADGTSVYATNSTTDNISMYSRVVGTGVLTDIGTIAAGTRPNDITISRDGNNVYAVNTISENISGYTRNSTTGALTPFSQTVNTPSGPSAISMSVDGESVYVTDSAFPIISVYTRH